MANYDFVFRQPNGAFIGTVCDTDILNCDYTLVENQVGRLYITLPGNTWDESQFPEDAVIEIWRKPRNAANYLEGQAYWFVTNIQQTSRVVELHAESANSLLKRHIVAYQSGAQEARAKLLNLALDDMLKQAVREAFGSTAGAYSLTPDPIRDLSSYLSVEANTSQWGDPTDRRISSNILFDVATVNVQKAVHNDDPLVNPTTGLGRDFYWDIVSTRQDGVGPFLELRTYAGQRLTDRRGQIVFSEDERTLINARFIRDYGSSYNRIYAGGPGSGSTRIITTSDDPTLVTKLTTNPFALREKFLNAKKAENAAEVQGEGDQAIRRQTYTPYVQLTGSLSDSACLGYGRDFFWGDYATAFFKSKSFDVHVTSVHVHLESGQETVEIQVSEKSNLIQTGIPKLMQSVAALRTDLDALSTIDNYA